ncbi:nuclear pore complex protein-like protein Nup107 [Lojkania enalia]|uniref:Nuclear pore complex protein n=1 Tax=Lojkania enalia TaxID=147567 RepID=A0A9P4KDH3_9PLEO|nr:nuclear pore complex protein-like protein Nup107 [Didymosphaeria enalia]
MALQFKPSQSAVLQFQGNTIRGATGPTPDHDPLQPLRAMADRVGKEVEKFAEQVDSWHAQNGRSEKERYRQTLRIVGKFKNIAEATVKELKAHSDTENKGELDKSVRRRIKDINSDPERRGRGGDHERSIQILTPSSEPPSKVTELREWQAELATWELLQRIIEHYHPEPGLDVVAQKRAQRAKVGGAYRYSPNHEIWDRFVLEDDHAKEKAIILRWLEQTARNSESDIQSITENLEALSGKDTSNWTSGWLDTKSRIKQVKRMRGKDGPLDPNDVAAENLRQSEGDAFLVTQLDPDAMSRQNRALEKSDEYYERALWMVCYEMLRRGVPWEEISEFCKDKNEAWRGVSIGAAYESHPDGGPNVAGPTVGFLFRRMCLYAAKGAKSPYEEAIYGLLSGSYRPVETVCRTWEDHLYARYNALLLSKFDNYLVKEHPHRVSQTLARKFVFQDASIDIGDWKQSSSKVIQFLKQQRSTSAQALSPLKLIQGSLISRTVDELLYDVGHTIFKMLGQDSRPTNLILGPDTDALTVLSGSPEEHFESLATDPHGFRILVHIYIVLRRGLKLYEDTKFSRTMDNVLAAYIEFLRFSNRLQPIPLYAAQLDADRQVHCLARILPDVKNPEEQEHFISLMDEYHINAVHVISQNYDIVLHSSKLLERGEKRVFKFEILERTRRDQLLWPGARIKAEFPGLNMDPKDEALIESLQWYNHLGKDIKETFMSLSDALRAFLLNGRLGAAIKLVTEMSVESLSLNKTETLCGYAFDFTVPGTEVQDRSQVDFTPRRSTRRGTVRPSENPKYTAHDHAERVQQLRHLSNTYQELQLLVRAIMTLQEWREEEDNLIRHQTDRSKANIKRAKDLFENLSTIIDAILDTFLEISANGDSFSSLPETPPNPEKPYLVRMWNERMDFQDIKKIFIPEILIAYLSVIQAYSFFITSNTSIKAMELATVVADDQCAWLQKAFMDSGRMAEFVDALAEVSKAMLRLGARDDKKKTKKRGSRGEMLRIWDLNANGYIEE